MKKDPLVVILSRDPSSAASQYRIPRAALLLAQFAGAVFFAAFLLSSLHYLHMWRKSSDHAHLTLQAERLRNENRSFEGTVRQLREKVASLDLISQRIQILSGSEEQGLGGIGGPDTVRAGLAPVDTQSLVERFHLLEQRSATLENDFRLLLELSKTRAFLRAATPSIMPVQGHPSDRFGYRKDPFTGLRDYHPGIDISAPYGNKVKATADGTVVFAGRKMGYGKLVKIEHKFDLATFYGHLSLIAVRSGQEVKKGDIIGYVGSTGRATGPHVHYEVRLDGRALNPLSFLREQ